MTDDSGQVGAGTEVVVPVGMNAPPTASAGEARTVAPGETVVLDGGASVDGDGRVAKHEWTFGDDAGATGRTGREAYEKPGL